MADETSTKANEVTVLCPFCSELYEVKDARLVMLAQHLAQFCPETEGILHDG